MESRRLVTFDPTTLCYKRIPVAGPQHNVNAQGEGGKKKTKEKSTKVASAFPEVDRFIKNLVENNGGYVRKISFQDCWFLIYELANCRYCHNIKRPHKSNNVKFVVDLRSNQYCQMCHDPQCKDFRSDFWALPSHCAIPWQELFESEEEAKSPTQWDSSLNEADEKELEALLVEAADNEDDEKELEALLVEAADKTQDENDMEALLLEAAAEDETENQEENNDEAIEALLLEAEKEAAEDEFLLKVYSQNLPF